jgi:hypothetical protein
MQAGSLMNLFQYLRRTSFWSVCWLMLKVLVRNYYCLNCIVRVQYLYLNLGRDVSALCKEDVDRLVHLISYTYVHVQGPFQSKSVISLTVFFTYFQGNIMFYLRSFCHLICLGLCINSELNLYILWHVDPLLGNDSEISKYTTAFNN